MRLLLVEDDAPLASGLAATLRLGGYAVDTVTTLADARAAVAAHRFDAAILDLNLPDGDGLALLRAWRNQRVRLPVLILSARDAIEDRVGGLDLGADDYLTKPFDLPELEARLRVLIRRNQGGWDRSLVEVGPLSVDTAARRATLNGIDMGLTAREFALLRMLAMRAGQIQPKEALMARLSDFEQDMSPNALDILVHRLRKKLADSGLAIRTLRGLGYLLEEEARS
ncbi:response regulator [uncultured Aquabacterium sp.]|nr:response regulator [uncultured Aquabacterium sp.]